ncbi:DUF6233 domain-containing protein [Streptomyces sp. NPDC002766]|uniref:DUF6233 domain-containing protein n=1 Tax=Streptomyces sp. NPDC002766 TaxID=3154429 RepID=UPI0033318069
MTSADPTPPRVRVTLPDGQQVLGYLHERRQWAHGGWMYWVGLAAWANDGEKESVEPREYRAWLTAKEAQPVDGVSYDDVPTYPLPRETRQKGPAGDRWAWKIQRVPSRDGRPGRVVVHVWDCPDAPRGAEELDVYEAIEVLTSASSGAVACKECEVSIALGPFLDPS